MEDSRKIAGRTQVRMHELVAQLTEAARAYYAEDREIMSNQAYDALYDELAALEKETGIVLANSPTVQVGYEAVDALPKEAHERPMLSLDKTKERETLRAFIGGQKTLLSWKLDGLTIVLTYRDGKLAKAVTRGNGEVGEVVTPNARTFVNLPLQIAHMGELVLRGEAIITYSDFARINAEAAEVEAQYKNPRNLCSGSVRQLNSEITAQRSVRFYAFGLVSAEGVDFENSHERELTWLAEQGFETVAYRVVTEETLDAALDAFADEVQTNDFPSDGLVALYDDIVYGASLGTTAKFPRNAFAFKWADELATTHLREIEWSPSRTGLLNPVAIFDPVELEGTTVTRASVHNVSIVRELALGIGDEIEVYKANMIIPQIAENHTKSGTAQPPETCPVCGAATILHEREGVETLYCPNPACPAKGTKAYTLFVSRDAMNIEGLSEQTLEKFLAQGFLHGYVDLFHLDAHKEAITAMEGFGETSYENLIRSVEASRETTLSRLVYALGIPGVGLATARLICRAFDEDITQIRQATEAELTAIDGIGDVTARDFAAWWADAENAAMVDALLPELRLIKEFEDVGEKFAGLTFVITGSLAHFSNRKALKEKIEQEGGKVAGSVSSKTSYLINNDVQSASSKNRTARELGIPILSEEDFMQQFEVAGDL